MQFFGACTYAGVFFPDLRLYRQAWELGSPLVESAFLLHFWHALNLVEGLWRAGVYPVETIPGSLFVRDPCLQLRCSYPAR